MSGSDAPEGRLVQAWGGGETRLDRAGCDGGEGGPSSRGAGGPGEAAGGEALGDTRSLGGGGAPPCAWGGASPQTGQLSKGCPLGQLRFPRGAAGPRGRGGSGALGGWRLGRGGRGSAHRAGGRATCPGGQVSKGRGGGRRALWETKPEVGVAESKTRAGLGWGWGGGGRPAGKGRKGLLHWVGGGPRVRDV